MALSPPPPSHVSDLEGDDLALGTAMMESGTFDMFLVSVKKTDHGDDKKRGRSLRYGD
jgi:hypothetical protein